MNDNQPWRPLVLLDADGVLLDFHSKMVKTIEPIIGKLYKAEDFKTWDLFDTIGREHEVECSKAFRAEGFCSGIPPYPEAVKAVQELQGIAEVHVITAPTHSNYWYFERVESLMKHFGLARDQIHHLSAKHITSGDVLVEDKAETIRLWLRRNPTSRPFLFSHQYNLMDRDLDRYRINHWKPIITYVRTLSELRNS